MDKLTDVFGEAWGRYDGQCAACDFLGRVNDLGLCEECASKLERDLIREWDWDYAVDAERNGAFAFGLSADDREKLRCQVVAQYGEALELIAPIKRPFRSPRRNHSQKHAGV